MKTTLLLVSIFFSFSLKIFAGSQNLSQGTPVVLFTKTGNIQGTLLVPSTKKPIPVVLIIAGSGPTDRDGNNSAMKNNSLKLLAEGLYTNQIATLRYDKRGIAESKNAGIAEKDLRFEDYINDAVEWIKLLKADKRFSKIIVLGHSEGSLIGMVAVQKETVAGFISVAGAGQPADLILRQQLRGQSMDIVSKCNQVLDSLVQGKQMQNIDPTLNTLFRPSIQPYLISWFKYDPAQEIAKLKIPVLIIQGTTDMQVGVKDAKLLSAANPNAKYVEIEGMNHVFKTSSSEYNENIATYNDPIAPVKPVLISSIVNFINGIH